MASQGRSVREAPSTCPYCGQRLVNESAIAHLRRKQQELEEAQRSLERDLRARLVAEARAQVRDLVEQKVSTIRKAESRKSAQLADAVRELREQIVGLQQARRDLDREHKVEIAAVRRENEAARRKELREALRTQKESLRAQLATTERARTEREYATRLKSLDGVRRGLEEENERLKRQLEHLTTADRGEFNEEEVLQGLRLAFREDEIERSRRGQRGTDIFHRVRVNGDEAGLIIYECKDTLRWSNDFIAQCKRAGKTHGTSYLVLVSRAFPRNQKDLFTRDEVVVVQPVLLPHVARIMRTMVSEIHRVGLTAQGRAQKTEQLYKYLGGEDFRRTFGSLSVISKDLKQLLEKERDTHQRTWNRREAAYTEVGSVHSVVDEQIRRIIEAPLRTRGRKVIPLESAG